MLLNVIRGAHVLTYMYYVIAPQTQAEYNATEPQAHWSTSASKECCRLIQVYVIRA